MKAVFSWDSSSILTCQNPEAWSRVMKNRELQVGPTGRQSGVWGIDLPWSRHWRDSSQYICAGHHLSSWQAQLGLPKDCWRDWWLLLPAFDGAAGPPPDALQMGCIWWVAPLVVHRQCQCDFHDIRLPSVSILQTKHTMKLLQERHQLLLLVWRQSRVVQVLWDQLMHLSLPLRIVQLRNWGGLTNRWLLLYWVSPFFLTSTIGLAQGLLEQWNNGTAGGTVSACIARATTESPSILTVMPERLVRHRLMR